MTQGIIQQAAFTGEVWVQKESWSQLTWYDPEVRMCTVDGMDGMDIETFDKSCGCS